MDLKSVQKPLKEQYRNDPSASRITLRAKGGQTETPIACSVAVGRTIYQAQAHAGVGGAGTAACSGDLLLGAQATAEQLRALQEKTEQYCVVMRTLVQPPKIQSKWVAS